MAHKVTKKTENELLELGKHLQDFYDQGYVNKNSALTFSFLKGVLSGFGAVIGGTIMVGLLLIVLAKFDRVPFLGPVSDSIRKTIQTPR